MASKLYDNFSGRGNPKGILGDFQHAAELYRKNNFRLSPKVKFLYHVVLNINPIALASLGPSIQSALSTREINLLAQTVDLPTYTAQMETKNQYNRKKLVQTKLNYDPVSLIFHDDNAGLTTLLWEAYYRYYFQDGNYSTRTSTGRPNSYRVGLYDPEPLNLYRHGLDRYNFTEAPFFDSIVIHQLHPQNEISKFTSYTLVNPLIESHRHDTLDQTSGSGLMKNTMSIQYETVLYNRGTTTQDNPAGFGDDAHYDTTPSPYAYSSANESDVTPFENNSISLEGWAGIFFDAVLKTITQSDLQNQRSVIDKQAITPPITTNQPLSLFNNVIVPRPDTITGTTQTSPTNTNWASVLNGIAKDKNTLTNQQKLNDFSRVAFGLADNDSGRSIFESKLAYDNLSDAATLQVQTAVTLNANEIANGNVQGLRNDLQKLGIL